MIFWGKIEKGVLSIYNRSKVNAEIALLGDGIVEIALKHKKKRSIEQNSYLHAVLIPEFRKALNSVGYSEVKTDEQAKSIIKSMFLTRAVSNETGAAPVHYVQDTSKLSKSEMAEFVDEVIKFCAENMSYIIPYPGEKLKLDY